MLVTLLAVTGARAAARGSAMWTRCSVCKLPVFKDAKYSPLTGKPDTVCHPCYDSLKAELAVDRTADLKARQTRRRELKPLLADLLRQHAANRAEIAKKILTFVGFDLPGE